MKTTRGTNSILIEFTDEELLVLRNDLLDPLAWVETAASEKLANCKERLLREWTTRLQQEKRVPAIPTDEGALLELIKAQPDYKTRVGREAEQPI